NSRISGAEPLLPSVIDRRSWEGGVSADVGGQSVAARSDRVGWGGPRAVFGAVPCHVRVVAIVVRPLCRRRSFADWTTSVLWSGSAAKRTTESGRRAGACVAAANRALPGQRTGRHRYHRHTAYVSLSDSRWRQGHSLWHRRRAQ